MGPLTGRAAGCCAGFAVPGFINAFGGRGFEGRRGGRGRGRRNWFFTTGLAGWQRAAMGRPLGAFAGTYGVPFAPAVPGQHREPEILKRQADYLAVHWTTSRNVSTSWRCKRKRECVPRSPSQTMTEPRLQSITGFCLMSLVFRLRDMVRPPAKILAEAKLQPGMTVLDFGCGPGGFSLAAARSVGPEGRVYAVDIHPLAVRSVQRAAARQGLDNVRTIRGGTLKCQPMSTSVKSAGNDSSSFKTSTTTP